MKILFITLVKIKSLEERGIYTDLLRKFREGGHEVFVVSPSERRDKKKTFLSKSEGVRILNVRTFNLQKTNIVEKGIGTLVIEYQYLSAIKKYFSNVKFDIILYSTPPITFSKVIDFIKKRDNAYAYLLLKDIFPQNAVDMKMFKKGGILHKMFMKKEHRLYELSDTIGCMSEANKEFILKHNPEILETKVEVNPNSITPLFITYTETEKSAIRQKYNIPVDKIVFVYGGNLGVPQGVDFLMDTIAGINVPEAHILVVGTGTQYYKLADWFDKNKPEQATLLSGLPKEEYDKLLASCDVGMIFLDKRFTIPNFPSRLLSYLEMKKPVLAATDVHTDIGQVIENAECGYWVEAGNLTAMQQKIKQLCSTDLDAMGQRGWDLLQKEYLVERSCQLIEEKIHV